MAWGSKNSASQLTTIGSTEQFFNLTPTLNPREIAHCEVEAAFGTGDDVEVNVYATLDATAENWDDTPILSFVIDNGTDPNKVSFEIMGVYKFRVGVKSTGANAATSADFSYRLDGVSAI